MFWIEWVIVPQIDNSHIDLRFGCWLTSDRNETGGERHRGWTSGQYDPKLSHKNRKTPGRHEAIRTHEIELCLHDNIFHISNQNTPEEGQGFF